MEIEIAVDAEFILEGEPKPLGNGCYVGIPKKYINRKVKILILKEEAEKNGN